MAHIGSSLSPPSAVTLSGATSAPVYNVDAPTANAEVSQALSGTIKQVKIKSRLGGKVQVTLVSGESGTKFWTIPAHCAEAVDLLGLASPTLYMQSDQASDTIELWVFS